ncbi:MAG: hypothetical protein R8F63_03795 [Acidimicrobiales bacterium]|nr:hypothetical protein [Acidimicrobiales bacterium]
MSEHDDQRRHPLDALAESRVPELDPTSRDRIEAGLRVQHAGQRTASAARSPRRWLVAVPALAIALVIATAVLVVRDTAPVAALEVRDAQGVVVTLPDGSVVRDPVDGFELRDGAVVAVEIGGSITIDDVTLTGGTTVTVRDGRLVTDVVATTTTDAVDDRPGDAPPGDDPPTDTRATTTTSTTTEPVDRPADRPTTTTTSAPPDRPGDEPRPEPPRDGGDDPPPVDAGDGTDDGEAKDGVDVAVALRVRAGDGAIRVAWNAEGIGDEPWRVVVVRTTDGSVPAASGDGVVVGSGRHGELLEQRADFPEDLGEIVYRVLVLDEADGVVARSAPQTLRPPDS